MISARLNGDSAKGQAIYLFKIKRIKRSDTFRIFTYRGRVFLAECCSENGQSHSDTNESMKKHQNKNIKSCCCWDFLAENLPATVGFPKILAGLFCGFIDVFAPSENKSD